MSHSPDTLITKPDTLTGHALHRVAAGIAPGALHLDEGSHLRVRAELPADLRAFTLRASVCTRVGGRNVYPHSANWQARHEWLEREGERHGFSLLTQHSTSGRLPIRDGRGRDFVIDATDFVGVLKVTDPVKFAAVLERGVGRIGRAWGLGMLCV
jgi:hypothetical protein